MRFLIFLMTLAGCSETPSPRAFFAGKPGTLNCKNIIMIDSSIDIEGPVEMPSNSMPGTYRFYSPSQNKTHTLTFLPNSIVCEVIRDGDLISK